MYLLLLFLLPTICATDNTGLRALDVPDLVIRSGLYVFIDNAKAEWKETSISYWNEERDRDSDVTTKFEIAYHKASIEEATNARNLDEKISSNHLSIWLFSYLDDGGISQLKGNLELFFIQAYQNNYNVVRSVIWFDYRKRDLSEKVTKLIENILDNNNIQLRCYLIRKEINDPFNSAMVLHTYSTFWTSVHQEYSCNDTECNFK